MTGGWEGWWGGGGEVECRVPQRLASRMSSTLPSSSSTTKSEKGGATRSRASTASCEKTVLPSWKSMEWRRILQLCFSVLVRWFGVRGTWTWTWEGGWGWRLIGGLGVEGEGRGERGTGGTDIYPAQGRGDACSLAAKSRGRESDGCPLLPAQNLRSVKSG